MGRGTLGCSLAGVRNLVRAVAQQYERFVFQQPFILITIMKGSQPEKSTGMGEYGQVAIIRGILTRLYQLGTGEEFVKLQYCRT